MCIVTVICVCATALCVCYSRVCVRKCVCCSPTFVYVYTYISSGIGYKVGREDSNPAPQTTLPPVILGIRLGNHGDLVARAEA